MRILGLILIALVLTTLIIPITTNIITTFITNLPKPIKHILTSLVVPFDPLPGGGDPIDGPDLIS